MRLGLLTLVFWIICPALALAGAWMREDGTFFVSVETALRHSDSTLVNETEFYLDYGVTPFLSIGATAMQVAGQNGHATLFLRFPVRPGRMDAKMAVQFDLGAYFERLEWSPMYKATLAYGRGFNLKRGHGWLNLEAAMERRTGLAHPFFKLDTTIGQSSGRRFRPMAKLGLTRIDGQPLIWVVSGHVLVDGPKRTTWSLGIERKHAGQSSVALRIGLWNRF